MGEPTVAKSLFASDIVFSGEVLSVKISNKYDSLQIQVSGDTNKKQFNWKEIPVKVVMMRVSSIFKGEFITDTLTILTPPYSGSCGVSFQIGKKYIVYGTRTDEIFSGLGIERKALKNNAFWTHQCTRTQEWNMQEIDELIKLTK